MASVTLQLSAFKFALSIGVFVNYYIMNTPISGKRKFMPGGNLNIHKQLPVQTNAAVYRTNHGQCRACGVCALYVEYSNSVPIDHNFSTHN